MAYLLHPSHDVKARDKIPLRRILEVAQGALKLEIWNQAREPVSSMTYMGK